MAGIVGVVSDVNCVNDIYYALRYLTHRAPSDEFYCGIGIGGDNKELHTHQGSVSYNYPSERREKMKGSIGIGAVSGYREPVSELSQHGGLVTCFDGNIINYEQVKNTLLQRGVTFNGYNDPDEISDTVLISTIISKQPSFEKGIEELLGMMKGDFAVVSMNDNGIFAARGYGMKPLIIGKRGDSYIVASESTAFINTEYRIVRDVNPGEVVHIGKNGIETLKQFDLPVKYGTFEWVYTAYPPSTIDGVNVALFRIALGTIVAERNPIEADLITCVPNSGRWHGIGFYEGYKQVNKVLTREVWVRHEDFGRSFTPGTQVQRQETADYKLIPIEEIITGKRIIVVDDSIVRGTQTSKKIRKLREFGAKEVHVVIECPPLMSACRYGKTTKNDEDCIARRVMQDLSQRFQNVTLNMAVDAIQNELKADSLTYATAEDIAQASGKPLEKLCLECWAA